MKIRILLISFLMIAQNLCINGHRAHASTFEERIQEYINDVLYGEWGQKLPYQRNSVWAYFMRPGENTEEEKERIHIIVRAMVLGYDDVMPEHSDDHTVGFFNSIGEDNALIFRVLLQFRDRITQEDYDWIIDQIRAQVMNDNGWLIGCNGNSRIQQLVGLYLFAEHFDRNASITYWREAYMGDQWVDFTYEGRSYKMGANNHYNAYQFARDYLQYTLDLWVNTCDYISTKGPIEYWEFDSAYSHAYFTAMAVLYDLAQDPVMKRKAKMALDLWVLDYYLDYSPVDHGGGEGRKMGPWRDCLDYILLGIPKGMHPAYPSRDFFVTTYRMPEIIADLVDLSDEPDSYFHVHKEYNPRLHEPGKGKKTFVTKYCTLGGNCTWDWELNLGTWGPLWRTITLSINDKSFDTDDWWDGGEFYQYRNYLTAQGANLHCNDWSYFEKNETLGDWRFLKLGKAMVAISGGVEVCIEGADYPSFDDFKQAVLTSSKRGNATSKGVQITFDPNTKIVYADGDPDDDFPYKRMETIDNDGNALVSWQNNQMILAKHGQIRVYDFNSWTWHDGAPDDVPPNAPRNLRTQNIQQNEIILSWDAPDPASDGDRADHYLIYRNQTKIATPKTNSHRDVNLKCNTTYDYEIFAVDDAGNTSTTSATGSFKTLPDTLAPELADVIPLNITKVQVIFTEPVDQASAENVKNYLITPDLTIATAALDPDSVSVILSTSAHQLGTRYTLTVQAIKDCALPPNPITHPISKTYTFLQKFFISELIPTGYDTMRIKAGDRCYVDRDYVVSYIPDNLNGLLWIRTGNDDKEVSANNFVSFHISGDATIYVAYDGSANAIPSWLTGWQEINKHIETNDAVYTIYLREFSAGKVILGGNAGNRSSSMYLVLIDASRLDRTPPAQVSGVSVRYTNGH